MSSSTAIILMNRSKKIPYASKFLSTGLLIFDVYFIIVSTVRKFILDHTISLNVQTSVALSLQLANLTVGVMTVERYILILKPMWYIRTVSKKLVRILVIFIWLLDISLSMLVRYGVCYIKFRSMSVFTEAGVCNGIMSAFYGIVLLSVVITSLLCYYRIFKCIRSKHISGGGLSISTAAKRMYSYRSTFLVFIYLLVIIVSALAYGTIIILIQLKIIKNTQLRLAMEFVSLFNCLLDPFLYVLWFKECRLQLMLFIARFLKRYRHRAETMRMDVFNIVGVNIPCTENYG